MRRAAAPARRASDLGGRFDGVGSRVDDAEAQLLALEPKKIAGAFGGVLEHELSHGTLRERRRERLVTAAKKRALVAAPVAAADVEADPHAGESPRPPG